jgi:hypothetical protein
MTANAIMTPLIEVTGSSNHHFKTPNNYQQQQQHTPMNNYRRNFTPQFSDMTMNNTNQGLLGETTMIEQQQQQQQQQSLQEQIPPEYCLEYVWTEPAVVAGDSSFNEKASKFFHVSDLYNQKYVCYLMSGKAQLRCLKIDADADLVCAAPVGNLSFIPARDATFIESRNLMVVLDTQGGLFVYSGLTKLCKIQLHNIVWSSSLNANYTSCNTSYGNLHMLNEKNKQLTSQKYMMDFQSPIITPIKSKLFSNNAAGVNSSAGVSMHMKGKDSPLAFVNVSDMQASNVAAAAAADESNSAAHQHMFKTPKQGGYNV